jgi:hypothetical protein
MTHLGASDVYSALNRKWKTIYYNGMQTHKVHDIAIEI